MSCDVGEVTERLENEFILQPSFCFSYITSSSFIHLASRPCRVPQLIDCPEIYEHLWLINVNTTVITMTHWDQTCINHLIMINMCWCFPHFYFYFSDGKIATIGSTAAVRAKWNDSDFEHVIDATGKCILPGFVDAHTHPIWAGDRVHEFAMKVISVIILHLF